MVSLHGKNSVAFKQSWSVIMRMVSYPLLIGSFMMKSRVIIPKGNDTYSGVIGSKGGLG
jgi:hypothetical protein